jgi:hypothetical protein
VLLTRRVSASLLRPLFVLLLVAGSLTAERVRAADRALRAIDESFRVLGVDCERTLEHTADARGEPERHDGDDPPTWLAVIGHAVEAVPDGVRCSRAARAAYPIALARHRPCAAPPTGPPLT